jgi:hypothetical protein
MSFSMAESRFWLASAPNRPIAISWPRRSTVTPIPRACIYSTLPQQGLKPDYTVADAGQGLRAGQKASWGDARCHGDILHIIRQCEG